MGGMGGMPGMEGLGGLGGMGGGMDFEKVVILVIVIAFV